MGSTLRDTVAKYQNKGKASEKIKKNKNKPSLPDMKASIHPDYH
jgi:hypothetical protein